jgi:hypothetical protein
MKLTEPQQRLVKALNNGVRIYGRDKGRQYKDRRYVFDLPSEGGGLVRQGARLTCLYITMSAQALIRKGVLRVTKTPDGHLLEVV